MCGPSVSFERSDTGLSDWKGAKSDLKMDTHDEVMIMTADEGMWHEWSGKAL